MLTKGNAVFLLLIVCLGVAFIVITYYNFASLQTRINEAPTLELQKYLTDTTNTLSVKGKQPTLATLALLEFYTIRNRYHQANTLLAAKLWINYLGFFTGMILSLMGGFFVVGRFREPKTDVAGTIPVGGAQTSTVSLKTSSPGLFLTLMGTILMVSTIVVRDTLEVKDQSIYIYGKENAGADSTRKSGSANQPANQPAKDPSAGPSKEPAKGPVSGAATEPEPAKGPGKGNGKEQNGDKDVH